MIDWSVFKNWFFDPIIDSRSYMNDFFIFLWSIFRFFFLFWQVFTIHVQINLKIRTAQSKPWYLSICVRAYGALNTMKLINKRSIIDQQVHRSFSANFSINLIFLIVDFRFKSIIKDRMIRTTTNESRRNRRQRRKNTYCSPVVCCVLCLCVVFVQPATT